MHVLVVVLSDQVQTGLFQRLSCDLILFAMVSGGEVWLWNRRLTFLSHLAQGEEASWPFG